MEVLNTFFTFISNNILTRAELFVGLIVLIGYILLGRKWYETMAGFIKAVVGYMILNVGSAGLVTAFRPILAGLNQKFHLNAVVIDPYFGLNAVNAALENIGLSAAWTMTSLLLAFLWNILLLMFRKVTKLRTLLLTGHIMVQQATTVTWIVFLFVPGLRNIWGAVAVGILVGTYQAVFSNLTVEPTDHLTDGEGGFAIGHQQMFAVWLTDKIAPKIGKKEDSIENIKLPGFLQIFSDNVVSTSVLMFLFFGVIMAVLGEDFLRGIDDSFSKDTAFIIYIFSKALSFTVYLNVLQAGVRMFVAELTESFKGISDKLLPGAIPAVDCAVAYGFGPANAVTIGFFFGAIGQFLAIAGLLLFHSPVMIIAGFVPLFFDNATIAVYANKRGGVKAAMILPFVCGVVQVMGGAVCALLLQMVAFGGWHGNIDFSTIFLGVSYIVKYLKVPGIILCVIAMLAIPQLQYLRSDKEKYFKIGQEEEY